MVKLTYAQFLNDHSELLIKPASNNTDLVVTLPKNKPLYNVPVIELSLQ
jgi:alpha-L-fucosidase